jgi:hypothetical protein
MTVLQVALSGGSFNMFVEGTDVPEDFSLACSLKE